METTTTTKKCSKCGKTYPATLEYFQSQKRKNGKPGLHSWCKPCKQADARHHNHRYYAEHREECLQKSKEQYILHPEKQRARHRKWYLSHTELSNQRSKENARTLRLAALNHYGCYCHCCGETHIEFLAIDHINGGGRKHRQSISSLYRWLRNNGYPEGFRVLCHNCNQSLGHYGYCPHNKPSAPTLPS